MLAVARVRPISAPARRRLFPVEASDWTASAAAGVTLRGFGGEISGAHPLADRLADAALQARQDEIAQVFDGIEPMLADLARDAASRGDVTATFEALRERHGLVFDDAPVQWHWARPLPWGLLHAHAVLAAFVELANRRLDHAALELHEGEPVAELVARWGFHAIDITPCADGRLSGLTEHILRIPRGVITGRRSYAGAMFDIEQAVSDWRAAELDRIAAGAVVGDGSRYLKIGVYHFSAADPRHEGCAAHGSDTRRAQQALLERLEQFAAAVHQRHGRTVATLLVGVNTDDDGIRVHVPDAAGRMALDRWLDSADLMALTCALVREDAKALIRREVAACAGVPDGDAATEGMRWLCGYLLKNNIGRVDAVRRLPGGRHPELGHAERLIVAGDPVDEVQLRNLAFQTQFTTHEEGAADLAVGLRLLAHSHAPRGLAVPVLACARHDRRLPGDRERAAARSLRHARAIMAAQRAVGLPVALLVRAAIVDECGGIEFADQAHLGEGQAFTDNPRDQA